MPVTRLTRALGPKLQIVRHFFVAYFYDLSQYDDNLAINQFGLPTWAPAGLPGPETFDECVRMNWWIRDQSEIYLIEVDYQPAGFVMILSGARHLPAGVEYELMDFYITPKYRRMGVGREAARQAFDLHHGRWVVHQLPRNTPALRFWHQLIAEYTDGQFEMFEDGAQQQFDNRFRQG